MIKFENKDWTLSICRNFSIFHNSLECPGYFFSAKKYGFPARKQVIISHEGKNGYIFTNSEDETNYLKKLDKICLSKQKIKKLEKVYYKFGENLLKRAKELKREKNIKSYKNFISAYKDLTAGLYITLFLGRHISEKLFNYLKNFNPSLSKEEIDILISEITYPDKHTPLTKSQIKLLEIGALLQKNKLQISDIKNDKKIYSKYKNFYKKYSAIPVNLNGDPWTEQQILKQLSDLMKKDCAAERELILKNHKDRISKRNKLLVKLPVAVKQMAYSLQVGTFLNEYRKFVFCHASLAYHSLLKEIANNYHLNEWREGFKLTYQEVSNLYFKRDISLLKKIKERKWMGITFKKNKLGYRLLRPRELGPFLREINSSPKDKEIKSDNIQGTIANKGVVRAAAKIILGSSDFAKFNEGDVIVAIMTSVDFVPLMKKASAFVTDEGGISCHAAIVSRELNKPCLVGTKIATKVLKDGDLVEVDANKGIVKILERK